MDGDPVCVGPHAGGWRHWGCSDGVWPRPPFQLTAVGGAFAGVSGFPGAQDPARWSSFRAWKPPESCVGPRA
jgi:hypothetical protein